MDQPRSSPNHRQHELRKIPKAVAFHAYLGSGYVPLRDALLARLGCSPAVVLCYHRIGACDPMSRPTDQFQRDLNYLKQHYDCLSLASLSQRLLLGERLTRRIAVITFDDGYRDNFSAAVPALLSAGLPATFFVVTGYVGTDRVFPHDARTSGHRLPSGTAPLRHPLMTWNDLRAIEAAGFEVGSHTVNHVDLGRANRATMIHEIHESLATLNRELGIRRRAFAFPWGQPANVPPEALSAVKEAGYYAAVTMFGGSNSRGTHPLAIHRTDAGNGGFSQLAWRARIAGLDPDRLLRRRKKQKLILPLPSSASAGVR